jgi:chromosome segregation ATPase
LKDAEIKMISQDFDVLTLDYDTLKDQLAEITTQRDELDATNSRLRKEQDQTQLSSLPAKINGQIEQDHINNAILAATQPNDKVISELEEKLKKAENMRKMDEKTIRDLSQDKAALKTTNQDLEEKFSSIEIVQTNM